MAGAIVDCEGASAFQELIESGGLRELRAEADRIGGYAGALVPAVDYLRAMRIRERMRAPFQALFEKFYLLVAPSRNTVALPIGTDFNQAYPELEKGRPPDFASPIGSLIQVGNLLGYPAISLPNGFGRFGLPTGIQLLARPLEEPMLVSLGAQYQHRTQFHEKRPPGY